MRPVPRRAALALLAAPLLTAQAPAPVFPPGSAIGIVPPRGMQNTEGYAGFVNLTGASIRLMQLPAGAYADLGRADAADPQQIDGFVVAERQQVEAGGLPAVLLRGMQTAIRVEHQEWLLIARPPGFTGVVRVRVQAGAAAEFPDEKVRAVLATVAFRTLAAAGDPLALLPFGLNDLAGFRLVVAGRSLLGMSALLTEGLLDDDPEQLQPMMGALWGPWPSDISSENRNGFARSVTSTGHLRDPELGTFETVVLPSGTWFVREAAGDDRISGHSMFVLDATLVVDAGLLSAFGECRAEVRTAMAPRFRQAASSAYLR